MCIFMTVDPFGIIVLLKFDLKIWQIKAIIIDLKTNLYAGILLQTGVRYIIILVNLPMSKFFKFVFLNMMSLFVRRRKLIIPI